MTDLTPAEKTFIARMAFHIGAGLSFEDSARAVIEDDRRIHARTMENTDAGQKTREAIAASVWMNSQARAINERFA